MRINASEMGEQDNSVLGWVMVVLDVLFMVASAVSAVLMVVLLRQSVRKDRMENATSASTPPKKRKSLSMVHVKKALAMNSVLKMEKKHADGKKVFHQHLAKLKKHADERMKKRLMQRRQLHRIVEKKVVDAEKSI